MKSYIRNTLTIFLLFSTFLNAGVKSKAAKEVVKLFKKYGREIVKKVPPSKMDELHRAAKKLPITSKTGINRLSAGKLIVKYGDDAVNILIKHPDDGLWALKNGGEFVAKNYNKMGKPLLKFLGKNGKRGPKVAKHLGIDLSNDILKISKKNGLLGLQNINPKLLKEAITKAPDKILKSNIIRNTAKYGDEFLQFTLKYKKPIIYTSVFTGVLVAGYNKYPLPPNTLQFNDPEFQFDSDGIPVSQNNNVKYYLNLFSDKNNPSYDNIRRGLNNYSKYKHIIEPIIHEYGLPTSLIAIAILESSLDPMAGSHKGAVGPWQFLKSTAKDYGLKINSKIDERRNIEKSTIAACKHFTRLRNSYKDWDWPLIMTAYNTGEGNLKKALKATKTENYWELAIKSEYNKNRGIRKGITKEARNYVPQIMAVLTILNEPIIYNHYIHDDKKFEYEEITIDGKRSVFTYAESCGLTAKQLLRDYNPELYTKRAIKHLKKIKIPKNYKLKIPVGTKFAFNNHLSKEVIFTYQVQKGDTLFEIAKRNKVWVWQLKRRNGIKNANLIRVGQMLEIPMKG